MLVMQVSQCVWLLREQNALLTEIRDRLPKPQTSAPVVPTLRLADVITRVGPDGKPLPSKEPA